jgi:hypothetical protein
MGNRRLMADFPSIALAQTQCRALEEDIRRQAAALARAVLAGDGRRADASREALISHRRSLGEARLLLTLAQLTVGAEQPGGSPRSSPMESSFVSRRTLRRASGCRHRGPSTRPARRTFCPRFRWWSRLDEPAGALGRPRPTGQSRTTQALRSPLTNANHGSPSVSKKPDAHCSGGMKARWRVYQRWPIIEGSAARRHRSSHHRAPRRSPAASSRSQPGQNCSQSRRTGWLLSLALPRRHSRSAHSFGRVRQRLRERRRPR